MQWKVEAHWNANGKKQKQQQKNKTKKQKKMPICEVEMSKRIQGQ